MEQGLWRRFLLLIPLAIAMAVGCFAFIRSASATYNEWTPVWLGGSDFGRFGADDVRLSDSGVVRVLDVTYGSGGAACITLQAIENGETDVTLGDDELSTSWHVEVRDGAILSEGVNFSGWESIHVCLCIFFAAIVALCGSVLVQLYRARWFGYRMVASAGGLLFFLFQFLFFTALLVRGSLRDVSDLAYMVASGADAFAAIGLIPMAVLALLVSMSNLSLIRHEGMRPVNVLGIVVSVAWLVATWFWYAWGGIASSAALPPEVAQIIGSAFGVALTYGECLLVATMMCAWIASRTVPDGAVDYLVVLGCGLRRDGTPSPLLAGRLDRAREFDAACVAAGGAPATFVPSGGQGSDEVIPEAEGMRNYLVDKGVDAERIAMEGRSTTTRENMAFSRKVIEGHAGRDVSELRVGFSTTNYHVFRGYVCAHQAGMAVQGMGSKTRAYFWPNAFLREFAGLLAARWKDILVAYVTMAAVYALAERILIIM